METRNDRILVIVPVSPKVFNLSCANMSLSAIDKVFGYQMISPIRLGVGKI